MHSFFSSLLMFHIVCGSLMHNYSGLSLRFQVALIVAGGNPRPPALNDSPDIVTHIQHYFSHHIEKKDKFTSTPLSQL